MLHQLCFLGHLGLPFAHSCCFLLTELVPGRVSTNVVWTAWTRQAWQAAADIRAIFDALL